VSVARREKRGVIHLTALLQEKSYASKAHSHTKVNTRMGVGMYNTLHIHDMTLFDLCRRVKAKRSADLANEHMCQAENGCQSSRATSSFCMEERRSLNAALDQPRKKHSSIKYNFRITNLSLP